MREEFNTVANKQAILSGIGEIIYSIKLEQYNKFLESSTALVIKFKNRKGLKVRDEGQSCCEARYMVCDDDLERFKDATLLDIYLQSAPTKVDEYGDSHEIDFLVVKTSKGTLKVSNHNDHNGYYSGFDIRITEI